MNIDNKEELEKALQRAQKFATKYNFNNEFLKRVKEVEGMEDDCKIQVAEEIGKAIYKEFPNEFRIQENTTNPCQSKIEAEFIIMPQSKFNDMVRDLTYLIERVEKEEKSIDFN